MLIKVCGIKEQNNYNRIVDAGADWIGLNYYPLSPRYIASGTPQRYKFEKRVGIFVNESAEDVLRISRENDLDMVQLHGENIRATIDALKNEIFCIAAFGIDGIDDIGICEKIRNADFFVFDTKTTTYGGSGRKFNWNLLESYSMNIPFLLSGGISAEDARFIKTFTHNEFAGVDINSRFETEPGKKDEELVRSFISEIK